MSSTIDERVVAMRFDNKQFESAANESLSTLQKLGQVIDNTTSADNISKIANSVDGINFGSAVAGVESLADRFSVLGIVAKRVLEDITDALLGKLTNAISSVTGSIVSGGIKRAMNIENAHFQLQGLLSDEKEVQAIMQDAMDSVDGTAYAYDEAAKAASMFAASGLKSGKEMQDALRAIAGVAATTNADYGDMSRIFTTVAGQGKVMADQLNQLAVRGMNGAAAIAKYFNNVTSGSVEASEEVGKAIKELTKGMEISEADIREFVHDSKISFNMFSEAMATTFGDHAKDANQTFTGSLANIKAALARTGAMFFTPLINQNGKAVELFNAIRVKINEINKILAPFAKDVTDYINRIIEGLTKVVKGLNIDQSWSWKLQRGFFVVLQAARGLMDIINPIKEAFKEAFGGDILNIFSDIGDKLFQMSFNFRASEESMTNLKDGFKGIFDVIDLLIDSFVNLLKAVSPASDAIKTFNGNALELFGDVGRGLSKFVEWIRESETFNNIFEIITEVTKKATEVIKGFIDQLGDKAESGFDTFEEKLSKLASILETFKNGGLQVLKGLWKMITPLIDGIKKLGEELWKVLTAIDPLEAFIAFCNGRFMAGITNSFGKLAETVTHVLLDTILVSISNFILGLQELIAATTNFEYLVNALKALSQALLVLAAACFVLSTIDDNKLKKGMAAMTAFLIELMSAMLILSRFSNTRRFFGLSFKQKDIAFFYDLTDQIMKLAISVGLLAFACKTLGSMSFEDLAKGLIAVTVLLTELVAVGFIMQHTGADKSLTKIGTTLIMMSASLLILTKAVKELGSLDIASLAKGVTAIGAIMLEMTLFSKFSDGKNTRKAGLALIEMAAAIRILVISIKELGSMSLEELSKGLISLGIALTEMVAAINLMPEKKSMTKAFAMIEFAAALVIIAKSLQMLADLSPSGLLNAVITMGLVIFEMVVALQLMPNKRDISKAFAMIEFAVALVLISKALVPLTEVNPEDLISSVLAMGLLLFEMVGCLAIMQKVSWANIDALAIIEMAAALVLISKALVPLTEVDQGDLFLSVLSLGAMLTVLTGVLAILSAIGPMAIVGGVAAMMLGATAILLAIALGATAKALKMIKDLKLSEAEKDMDAFLAFMAKLSLVLSLAGILSPLINAFAISVAVVAGALSLAGIALANSMMKFTPALTQLGDAIQKLNDIKCDNFVKNAGPISIAIVKLGLAIKAFGPLAMIGATAFLDVADGINKLVDPMVKFSELDPDKLASAFKQTASGISEFGKSLKDFGVLSGIGALALNEVAEAIQKFAPALILLSGIPGAKINSMMTSLASGFKLFGEALDEYDIFSAIDAKALVLFADAVKNMAEPLVLLSEVPGAKINSTMLALASGFKEFGKAIEATPFWGAQGRSRALLNLCEGINSITESIPKLNDIDSETLLSKMTTIGNGFKKFGEALDSAPLFNSTGRAGGITALCDSVHNLADGISYFMNTTSDYKDNVGPTLESIGNAFKIFGEALDSAPLIGSSSRGEGIAALVNNISTLSNGIEDFSSKDFSNFSFTTAKISGAFKSFGQALSEAPMIGADKRGEGIATLIDSLSTLSEGIKKFSEVADADNFDNVMSKIKDAFIGFSEALDNTPWFSVEDRAGGIGAVVSNVKTLAEGVGAFKDLDFNYITLLDQLGKTLGDFGKAIDETPFWDNDGRAEAIVKVVNALSPLADSAIKMGSQNGASAALQGFSSSISGLGNALSNNWEDVDIDMITSLERVIEILNNISTINTNSLSAVNTAVSETIKWLKDLCSLDIGGGSKMDIVANLASQFVDSIRNLSSTIVVVGNSFVDSWIMGIKQKFGDVSTTANTIGNLFAKSLETQKSKLSILAGVLINEFVKGLQHKQIEITNAGTVLGNKLIDALNALQDTFNVTGSSSADKFISGIDSRKDYARAAGTNVGQSVIDALNDLYVKFVDTGKHVVDGFTKGINDNKGSAIDAGTSLGQAAYKAAQSALAVASPSKKFNYLGKMSGQGLINGLLNQIQAVENAGYALGESSFDGLKSAIDSIYDYVDDYMVDMNPTITPNVDLSEIQRATDKTSQMFNDAIAVSANNISGIPDRFSNFTYNQNEQLSKSIGEKTPDNTDVVGAISSLSDDISMLKDAMTSIQVVLDTGTMVGAMTPQIDQQLGMRQVYAGRGI